MPGAVARSRFRFLVPAIVVAALAGGAWWWFGTDRAPAAAYRTAPVDRGDLRVSISATGSLRALSTVDVGSQVSGQMLSVEVDFNDRVSAGQVIARIDPANFQARLSQTRADLTSARASLNEARATLKNAEADYARKQELAARQLIARSELDQALAARDQARARVGSAEAAVLQREAGVANAELELSYTELKSPVDGVVLNRAVEPGQTVAASFQTPVLFQIAEDLSQMRIELAIDESDVGQLREGQPVRFTVDAFPGRDFRGKVKQVRLSATNTQNVITYPVVVAVENPDGTLLPGMTANAEIEVSRKEGVLRVPNAALRYKPADAAEDAPAAGGMRLGGNVSAEIPALAATLGLTPPQQAALDADLAKMRERAEAARAAMAAGGGQGQRPGAGMAGGAPGGAVMVMGGPGGGAPSPEAIAQMIAKRMQENFKDFRASLDEGQRARFDAGVVEMLSARRITVYKLVDGLPVAVPARAGISDSSHTEIRAEGLAEGDLVVTGEGTGP